MNEMNLFMTKIEKLTYTKKTINVLYAKKQYFEPKKFLGKNVPLNVTKYHVKFKPKHVNKTSIQDGHLFCKISISNRNATKTLIDWLKRPLPTCEYYK